MDKIICSACSQPLVQVEAIRHTSGKVAPAEMTTLVGYSSPPGHNHDDNCAGRTYRCAAGHLTTLFIRHKCRVLGCDWVGKDTCWCHEGMKLDEWPAAELLVTFEIGKGHVRG